MGIHIRDCSYLWVYRHKSFCNTQFDISPIMLVQPQLQSGNGEQLAHMLESLLCLNVRLFITEIFSYIFLHLLRAFQPEDLEKKYFEINWKTQQFDKKCFWDDLRESGVNTHLFNSYIMFQGNFIIDQLNFTSHVRIMVHLGLKSRKSQIHSIFQSDKCNCVRALSSIFRQCFFFK